jgi:type IV secretory pathway VirB6-like protein
MGGSVLCQFLYQAYITNLAQVVQGYPATILGIIAVTVNGAVALYTIIIGKQLMMGDLSAGRGVTKLVRATIVVSLMAAGNYQTFIAQPITTTIPNLLSGAIPGQQGVAGAQAWDALINKIDNFNAVIHSQAVGFAYLADRAVASGFTGFAWVNIMGCFMIWCLAGATADLLVPLGVVVLPFYLFDATRGFAERWIGKIVSLFLVMLVTLMLGQIVVFQDAQFLQTYANNIAAAPAHQGFDMGADPDGAVNGLLPTTPGAVAGSTVNVDSAINTLGHACVVFLFGLFLMIISAAIALGIGGSSGFSAAPAFNFIGRAATGGRR